MKPNNLFTGALGRSKTLRLFRVAIAAPALLATITLSRAEDTKASEKPAEETASADAIVESTGESELANWVSFGMGGAFIRGDETAMMRRTRTNGSDLWGGIDSLHLEEQVSDTATLIFNGHALTGLEDYDFSIDLQDSNWGFVKAGYKQFRTWYDATGGYFPGRAYVAPFDDELSLDRGEAFFTAGLRMENLPEVTFSYRHLWRDGQKDSTSWNTVGNPKIFPALWDINESVDIFELDIAHTVGKTDFDLGFVYENFDVANSRLMKSSTGTPTITDSTQTHSDLFGSHLSGVTRFSDKLWLTVGALYTSMDTNLVDGARLISPASNSSHNFNNLRGGANVKEFATNVNLMWAPTTDLQITPSFRYGNENIDALSTSYSLEEATLIRGNPSPAGGPESLAAYTDMDSYKGAIDIRYTGIEDFVFFGNVLVGREDEHALWQDRYLPGEYLDKNVGVDEQEYLAGVNWYALSNLSFSLQGKHSIRDQELRFMQGNQAGVNNAANKGFPGGLNNFRPIMTEHDSEVDNLNVRATYRPFSNLSLVSRYDFVHNEFQNQGINWTAPAAAFLYPLIESGDIFSHIVSESVTWNPTERLYLQGTASFVSSLTDTPEDRFTGDFRNDYFAATLSAGYAIDSLTDLTAAYSYYGAANYGMGMPGMVYGLNTKENAINVTLTRMLAPNKIWNLRYGFMSSNTDPGTDQFGGYNDFDAHMLSTGLQIRF